LALEIREQGFAFAATFVFEMQLTESKGIVAQSEEGTIETV